MIFAVFDLAFLAVQEARSVVSPAVHDDATPATSRLAHVIVLDIRPDVVLCNELVATEWEKRDLYTFSPR